MVPVVAQSRQIVKKMEGRGNSRKIASNSHPWLVVTTG